MKSLIALECKRAFTGRAFIIALALALTLALLHSALVTIPYATAPTWEMWRTGAKGGYPLSFYNTWMGQTGYSIATVLYYVMLPLLVCIPFADSLHTDMHAGVIDNIVCRANKRDYFIAKVVAVIATAAVVAVLPQMVNIAIDLCSLPVLPPEPVDRAFPITSHALFSAMYYGHPALYVALYLGVSAVVSALLSLLCIVVAFSIDNRIIVVLLPFGLCIALQFLLQGLPWAGCAPINLISAYQPHPVTPLFFVSEIGLWLLATVVLLVRKVRSYEAIN